MTERDLQLEIYDKVALTEHFRAIILDPKPVLYQGQWIKTAATSGVGDLLVVCTLDRTCFMVEVKRVKGKQTKNQIEFMHYWRYWGQKYYIAQEPEHITVSLVACLEHTHGAGFVDHRLEALLRGLGNRPGTSGNGARLNE